MFSRRACTGAGFRKVELPMDLMDDPADLPNVGACPVRPLSHGPSPLHTVTYGTKTPLPFTEATN